MVLFFISSGDQIWTRCSPFKESLSSLCSFFLKARIETSCGNPTWQLYSLFWILSISSGLESMPNGFLEKVSYVTMLELKMSSIALGDIFFVIRCLHYDISTWFSLSPGILPSSELNPATFIIVFEELLLLP
jgi:hypothetical protein